MDVLPISVFIQGKLNSNNNFSKINNLLNMEEINILSLKASKNSLSYYKDKEILIEELINEINNSVYEINNYLINLNNKYINFILYSINFILYSTKTYNKTKEYLKKKSMYIIPIIVIPTTYIVYKSYYKY